MKVPLTAEGVIIGEAEIESSPDGVSMKGVIFDVSSENLKMIHDSYLSAMNVYVTSVDAVPRPADIHEFDIDSVDVVTITTQGEN